MAQAARLTLSDDHPLALELASLRAAVARYQHEAHATSVKLQRHSLETSHALERAHALERENVYLKDEVLLLRATPDITPHPASLQVPELTLALRRLSDKLTLTEETLQSRTLELATAQSNLVRAESDAENAYKLEADARAEMEEGKAHEHELERKVRTAEEERRLVDLVVQEYADLVRTLEGRPRASSGSASSLTMMNGTNGASASSITLVDSLAEGKSGLRKLFEEFNEESTRLEGEIARLQGENAHFVHKLDAEQERAEYDRRRLAAALTELEKYRMDDNTAAKMVSRYMKFSQSTTDSLQQAMESLKTRHTATAATMSAEITQLQKHLMSEQRQCERLRQALDELSEDISREAYGRRREISLRLAFLGREESLAEGLRRWIRKAREAFDRSTSTDAVQSPTKDVFARMTHDAESLLEALNGQPPLEEDSPGSVARITVAQEAVTSLTRELQTETDRRMELERELNHSYQFEAHGATHDLRNVSNSRSSPGQNGDIHKTLLTKEKDASQDTMNSRPAVPPPYPEAPYQSDPVPAPPETIPAVDTVTAAVTSLTADAGQQSLDVPADPPVSVPDSPATQILVSPPDLPVALQDDTTASLLFSSNESQRAVAPLGDSDSVTPAVEVPPLAKPAVRDGGDDGISVAQNVITSADVDTQPSQQPDANDGNVIISELPLTGSVDSLTASSTAVSHGDASPEQVTAETYVFAPSAVSGLGKEHTVSALTSKLPNDIANRTLTPQADLLADLAHTKHRYDDLQRAFRDCHLALKELKKDVSALPCSAAMAPIVQHAVERLNDYNEDARVELEIRATDEARIVHGYETLLAVPGAISDEVDEPVLRAEMRAFVDGMDAAVAKAVRQFARKLDDLQHDIACIKRALYELTAAEDDAPPPTPTKSPAWSLWTAGLLSASRPSSPAPATTFGSVMTSPRIRKASLSSHSRRPSDEPAASAAHTDPFASLGLRIPMPAHILSPPRVTLRPRTISAMYMLGLGSRTNSFGIGTSPKLSPISPLTSNIYGYNNGDTDAEESEDLDSDVE